MSGGRKRPRSRAIVFSGYSNNKKNVYEEEKSRPNPKKLLNKRISPEAYMKVEERREGKEKFKMPFKVPSKKKSKKQLNPRKHLDQKIFRDR